MKQITLNSNTFSVVRIRWVKRIARKSLRQINELANQGFTYNQIAEKLGRGHRNTLKTETRNTIKNLQLREQELQKTTSS